MHQWYVLELEKYCVLYHGRAYLQMDFLLNKQDIYHGSLYFKISPCA